VAITVTLNDLQSYASFAGFLDAVFVQFAAVDKISSDTSSHSLCSSFTFCFSTGKRYGDGGRNTSEGEL